MAFFLGQQQDADHLEWGVVNRNLVMDFLLEMRKFMREPEVEKYIKERKPYRLFFGFMQGASFSLWRASFLIQDEKRKDLRVAILDHEVLFLEHLLSNNMIGYPQDRESQLWTSRYYINSAVSRILFMGKLINVHHDDNDPDKSKRIKDLFDTRVRLRDLSDGYFGLYVNRPTPESKLLWEESLCLLKLYLEFVKKWPNDIRKPT